MIPETALKEVKQSSDIVSLFQSYGLKLERKGKDWFTSCPFHADDTPSLSIDPVQNVFHCLGCGEKGNVYQLVQKMEGLTFPEAFRKLSGSIPKANNQKINLPLEQRPPFTHEELLTTLEASYQRMRDVFVTSPAANYYLQVKRGLEHIRDIEVGYCPTDFGRKLSTTQQDKLIQLGIMRDKQRIHMSACVVFPLRNLEGRLVGLYGRKIRGDGTHYYLPGPREGIFGIHNGQDDTVYITESVIDALSLNQIGIMSVLALHGVNGFTPVHEQWLKAKGIKTVYLMLDGDKPGREAAVKLQRQLKEKRYICHKLDLPNDEDPNSFFLLAAKKRSLKELEALPGYPKKTTAPELKLQKQGDELTTTLGGRKYTILGLTGHELFRLKVTVRVSPADDPGQFYIDSPDLYQASSRNRFEDGAVKELGADGESIHKEVKALITALEKEKLAGKENKSKNAEYVIPPKEQEAAMAYLKSTHLIKRILMDFAACGHVGEETNKLVCYLAAISRMMAKPLAIIIQSGSAGGKTALMDAVLAFMPEEGKVKYTAMTGQSVFYMGENDLSHKILAIVEKEGAEKATYAIKLMQSEGEVTIASAGKDAATGRQKTEDFYVKGPIMLFSASTYIDIDPELENRCLILTVDESREQTRAIQAIQRERETEAGLFAEDESEGICKLHKNVQRLLKPIKVINPYARDLTYTDTKTRTRRDQFKYLTLIKTIAFLHQYQRKVYTKTKNGKSISYIYVTLQDIELANRLANEVLGRTLDELPPQTRALLETIYQMVHNACKKNGTELKVYRFTRRQVREHTGWGHSRLAVHLKRLEEMEYLIPHHGGYGSRFEYELAYNGEGSNGQSFMLGLIDVEKLKAKYVKRQKPSVP